MARCVRHLNPEYSDQMNISRVWPWLSMALIIAISLSGCGDSSGSKPPNYAKALRGAPAPLAKLYSQANQLLSGGQDTFEQRLRRLRGYPIVVNFWASWCGNCRVEFPYLQNLSASLGKRIAFIGIDAEDSDDAAHTWLKEAPVPYPSITDPDRDIADSLGVVGFPSTAFYDRQGELIFLKQGAYRGSEELEAQIQELLPAGFESSS